MNKNHLFRHISLSIFSIFSILIFAKCNTQRKATIATIDTDKAQIIFINCLIKKTNGATVAVELIDTIRKKGRLKKVLLISPKKQNDSFKWVQLDKNNHSIDSTYFPNPLIQSIEYLNENRHFERKNIVLDSTYFNIRMQLHPQAQYLILYQTNKKPKLLTLKL